MKGIYWLASYPKSGNTWTRAFIWHFLDKRETAFDINSLFTGPISSSREIFDEYSGLESGELSWDEIERLRPEVFRAASAETEGPLYCKCHDAYSFLPDGQTPIIPPDVTLGALCLIRNPMDVCVSFAHHGGHKNYDRSLKMMNDPNAHLVRHPHKQGEQLPQRLLSWSGFIESWTYAKGFPVKVFRYEDMKQKPLETFTGIACFLGFEVDQSSIEEALEATRFERLQEQEKNSGFKEKLPRAKRFFRKGQIGSWREELNDAQVAAIIESHRDVMRKYGYLDEHDQVLY